MGEIKMPEIEDGGGTLDQDTTIEYGYNYNL